MEWGTDLSWVMLRAAPRLSPPALSLACLCRKRCPPSGWGRAVPLWPRQAPPGLIQRETALQRREPPADRCAAAARRVRFHQPGREAGESDARRETGGGGWRRGTG